MPGSSLGRHLESGVDPGNEVGNKLKVIRRQNETIWGLKYNRYGLRLAF